MQGFSVSLRRIVLAAILSVFLFPLGLFSSVASGAQVVKIGLLIPPQESGSDLGKAYLRGAEMAVAEVNASEGKQGIQLLLVLRGGHYLQRKELNELRELFFEERIHSLMGEVTKEAISSISGVAQEQGVPFLVFPLEFIDAASTGKEPDNLFWLSPAPEAFQRATVRTVAQFTQKRFYLLSRDSTLGRSWVKYFWEALKKLTPDAQDVGQTLLPGNVDDYGPYIQEILSANPEVCVSHLGTKDWLRFARIARKQGYFRQIVHFELESGSLESLVSLKKQAPEGVWGISAFPFWALGWKATQEFVAKYKEKTKSYPGLEALSGYVSVYALVESIRKTEGLDPEKMIRALEGLTFSTPVGPLAIRKGDHRALWPIWCGSSKFIPDYPFAVLEDLKAFGPDSFSPDTGK